MLVLMKSAIKKNNSHECSITGIPRALSGDCMAGLIDSIQPSANFYSDNKDREQISDQGRSRVVLMPVVGLNRYSDRAKPATSIHILLDLLDLATT